VLREFLVTRLVAGKGEHYRLLDSDKVYEALERQAAVLSRPPMTLGELLERLETTVPSFAQAIREHGRKPTGS
jgi:hypothetical protein